MSERFKVTTSKVVVGVTSPRVRIPPSPNYMRADYISAFFRAGMRTSFGFERERARQSSALCMQKKIAFVRGFNWIFDVKEQMYFNRTFA